MPIDAKHAAALALLAACASTHELKPNGPSAAGPAPAAQVAPAAALPEATALKTYDGAETSAIDAVPGERFVVALAANITTPFKWTLSGQDESVARLLEDGYTDAPPAGCEGCVGYGGTASFTFEAVGVGDTTLDFTYRGLGQSDGPAQRETHIVVRVR